MSDGASPRPATLVGLTAWPADSSLSLNHQSRPNSLDIHSPGREGVQLLQFATTQRLHPDSHFWLRSHTFNDCSFYLFR